MKQYLFLMLLIFAHLQAAPRDPRDINPLFEKPIPNRESTIMGFVERPGTFKQMYALLDELKLDIKLGKNNLIGGNDGKYTLFLPTDDALIRFGMLGLLRTDDAVKKNLLEKFVEYHIVPDNVSRRALKEGPRRYLNTLTKKNLLLKDIPKPLYSVELVNGRVYVIDEVLINPELKEYLRVPAVASQAGR
ncbi:fasciclin domain-containing protein [Candidatus Babeliales bacterium]|nr:fasciclin domain-containing protein [Candidatus Babeliales bacterium]